MTHKNFLNTAKVLVLALVLSFGIQYVAGQTWTPPTSVPPSGNTYAPLNIGAGVGGAGQSKTAGLTIGTAVADPSPALIIPTGRLSVGAGSAPAQKVDVVGNVKANGFCLTDTVAPIDPAGNCISSTWPTGGSGSVPNGTMNGQTLRWGNPGQWDKNNVIFNNGANVGIGDDTGSGSFGGALGQPGARLDVNGQVKIRGGSPGVKEVLTSDANGLATWEIPGNEAGYDNTPNPLRVCGLVPGKKYLAMVYGTTKNGSDSESYTISVTVNSVTTGIYVYNHPDGTAPVSIPVVATAESEGLSGHCLTVDDFDNWGPVAPGAPQDDNGYRPQGIMVVG